jgi:hypothetical protein
MNLKDCERKHLWAVLMYYPIIYTEELNKTTKISVKTRSALGIKPQTPQT